MSRSPNFSLFQSFTTWILLLLVALTTTTTAKFLPIVSFCRTSCHAFATTTTTTMLRIPHTRSSSLPMIAIAAAGGASDYGGGKRRGMTTTTTAAAFAASTTKPSSLLLFSSSPLSSSSSIGSRQGDDGQDDDDSPSTIHATKKEEEDGSRDKQKQKEEVITNEWELDCYSRPVLLVDDDNNNGKKKLWEVLVTDSSGNMRICRSLPSNKVNSREVRRVIEDIISQSEVKPDTIRFFRGAMFNMINIALSDMDVVAKPSRCTFALAQWIEERNRNVYPKMKGYQPTMAGMGSSIGGTFLDIRTAVKLPDALRGEKYAFVGLPLAEFMEGGGVNRDNIGVGRLCPVDPALPADAFVQGVVVLTSRASALASWLAGTEVAGVKADLRKRELVMETDIDNQYLMAKLNEDQRREAANFEEGKDALNGLHFICVQRDENDDDPAGFWLLREIPASL